MSDINRLSVISRISEFSFEHNAEELLGTSNPQMTPPTIDRLSSPSKSPTKLDALLKENMELKKKVFDQNEIITYLKKELYEMSLKVESFEKTSTIKSTELEKSIAIMPAEPINLVLPPRSVNRVNKGTVKEASSGLVDESVEKTRSIPSPLEHKHSGTITPLRSTANIDWDATLEALNASEDESEEDFKKHYEETNRYEKEEPVEEDLDVNVGKGEDEVEPDEGSKGDEEKEEEKEGEELREEVDEVSLVSGAERISSEEKCLQEPLKLDTPKSQLQSSPYSGRIQPSTLSSTSSPTKKYSPIKNPYGPTPTDGTPISTTSSLSGTPSLININQINQSNIQGSADDQRAILRSDSHSYGVANPRRSPVSPLRPAYPARPNATQKSLNFPSNSVPASPSTANSVISTQSNNEAPLAKVNLSDAYAGDFNHQSIYQDQNGVSRTVSKSPRQHTRFPSDVPLFVDPHHLSTIKPDVVSTLFGNPSKKSEDPVIILSANDRASGKEMWRFKKSLSQIVLLDAEIRPLINSFSLPPVPEKSLFLTNIPTRVDSRRMRVKDYFLTLFSIPNIPIEAAFKISRFMSLDVVNVLNESNTEALKDGWLLRRTKGLGNNWRARYCEIDGPFINVFETINGSLLEIIKLTNAQIGRQPDNLKLADEKSSFRHAFAVMEPKKGMKSNQFTKHIFCAETDEDRDTWVSILVQFTDDSNVSTYSSDGAGLSSQTIFGSDISTKSPLPSPSRHTRELSRGIEDDNDDFGSDVLSLKEAKNRKKRSFFPFGKKQSTINGDSESTRGLDSDSAAGSSNIELSLQNMNLDTTVNPTTVFQNELIDVFHLSHKSLFNKEIPSVLYRSLKYLLDKDAVSEEGLFRLNGSSALIRHLKESFDRDYDLDFDQLEQKPDINTIAGLLKLWFRELPSNILTKESYPLFKDAQREIHDPQYLAMEFRKLVTTLPVVNQNVLYTLFKFLNEVVHNKELNKMNLRNLCIVFSPTLNVASEVLIPFLVDFKCIFEGGEPINNEDREVLDVKIPTF